MNYQMFKVVLKKADLIANIHWIIEKATELKKKKKNNIYFCFIDYAKAFDCVDHKNFLRNLYAGQEATGHGATD